MNRKIAAKPGRHQLRIGWLYPELMSTYGDRGNISVFTGRCRWRGIDLTVSRIDFSSDENAVSECDLIFGGGAQDRQQAIMVEDLRMKKGPVLKRMFDAGVPGLFVCGAPQLLGHWYMTADGTKLEGLGIFDMVSRHTGADQPRLIGNTVSDIGDGYRLAQAPYRSTVIGFENHGGRTYLGKNTTAFSRVLYGSGNNGQDKTEGARYVNCIATYSHGPFLPKNPHIADWLIAKALEVRYGKPVYLTVLDDTQEWLAHDFMLRRLGITG